MTSKTSMPARPAGLLLTALLLGACGGSGPGGDAEQTGRFIDSPVEGLRYETPSRTGYTGANGEFTYADGERVTFSLGGIVLGSAPGAAEVSPFDLFDVEPPTTVTGVQAVLDSWNTVEPIDRALNVASLLIFLDLDSNPDNGIDLTGLDAQLATATIDFDHDFDNFSRPLQFFAGNHGISRPHLIDTEATLAHVYASLGLEVPVQALVRYQWDEGDDNSVDGFRRYAYDSKGRVIREEEDEDGDGNIEYAYTYEYDASARLVAEIGEFDDDSDGDFDEVERREYEYDAYGNEIFDTYETRVAETLELLSSRSVMLTWDDRGNLLSRVRAEDSDGDDISDLTETETFSYDSFGNRLSRVKISSGTTTRRETETLTYDAAGNNLTQELERDDGDDGSRDSYRTYVYSYDEDGNLLTFTTSYSPDGDENYESIDVYTYSYDADGNQLTSVQETANNGDQDPEVRRSWTSTYDTAGNRLTRTYAVDDGADDSIDDVERNVYSYDPAGNRLTHFYEADWGNNGSIDQARDIIYSYDGNGNRLTQVYTERDNMGNPTRIDSQTLTYGADNQPLSELREFNTDGVGPVESVILNSYEYQPIADGLMYLVEDFH